MAAVNLEAERGDEEEREKGGERELEEERIRRIEEGPDDDDDDGMGLEGGRPGGWVHGGKGEVGRGG